MNSTTSLSYDGSLNGLLTCIFLNYEEKLQVVAIHPPGIASEELFSNHLEVITEKPKAERVWKAFKKIATARGVKNIYFAYLSEEPGIELEILKYFSKTQLRSKDLSVKRV